jgi:hypothetical protein
VATRIGAVVAFVLLAACGCAQQQSSGGGLAETTSLSSSLAQKFTEATAPMGRSWKRMTETKKPVQRREWDWASGIPTGAIRAEVVSPTVSADTLASLVPEFGPRAVTLVSTHSMQPSYQIKNVGGLEVRNYGDLQLAVARSTDSSDRVQVDVVGGDVARGAPRVAMAVDPPKLRALVHAVARDQPVIRIVDDGNPWLMLREDGVCCRLMARVERERGLLQVVMSIGNCWGQAVFLPFEVQAYCDGRPLRCLSVSETLELLYDDADDDALEVDEAAYSFAAVSERDDYLTPTSYKRLHERSQEAIRLSAAPSPRPALADVPGAYYPGPAILGDARALTGFLLQRQIHQPGDPEQTGWIMFGGKDLCDGGAVEVAVDLGRGLRTYSFRVPEE